MAFWFSTSRRTSPASFSQTHQTDCYAVHMMGGGLQFRDRAQVVGEDVSVYATKWRYSLKVTRSMPVSSSSGTRLPNGPSELVWQ